MPLLEVIFESEEQSTGKSWKKVIPPDREIKVGRISSFHSDQSVEEWNRSDWVIPNPEDTYVSGCHASIIWKSTEGKLFVQRRMKPRETTNPIFYQDRPTNSILISPGDSFKIGRHSFYLLPGEVDNFLEENAVAPEILQQESYKNPEVHLQFLSRLIDLPQRTVSEERFEEDLLDLILKEYPAIITAAIIHILPDSTETKPLCMVQRAKHRTAAIKEKFAINHTLVYTSVRKQAECISQIRNSTGQSLDGLASDWTICSPIVSDFFNDWALYVEGKFSPSQLVSQVEDPAVELHDYQKFIEQSSRVMSVFRSFRFLRKRVGELESFVSPQLLIAIKKEPIQKVIAPRTAPVTVLFCDLRSSCLIAEENHNELEQLRERLRGALTIMTRSISAHDGVIGDLQGDAVMGFWGWPIDQEDQIDRAVRAALEIQREFNLQKNPFDSIQQVTMRCGIGIAHGLAVAGALGTSHHIKIDVFGPVVNLAARLEGMTKHLGTSILVNEKIATHIQKRQRGRGEIRTRLMGLYRPAGMKNIIRIHEILPPDGSSLYTMSETDRLKWETAIQDFINKRWPRALTRFQDFLNQGSHYEAATRIIDFIQKHHITPPQDWDGGIPLDQK